MTRVASWIGAAICVLAAASVDAFQISAASSKVSLTAGAKPKLELLLTPAQPTLSTINIETIVDTEGKTIVSDLEAKLDGSKYTVSVDNLAAGLYKMKVSAPNEKAKHVVYEVVPFRVTMPVKIAKLTINDDKLKPKDKLDAPVFSSGSNDALKISVQVQNTADKSHVFAHQAFLRFTHVEEKTETYFVLAKDEKESVQSANLQFAALSKKFSYKSGVHHVHLILGDARFDAAIVRDLGTVELQLAAAPPLAPSPLYAKPLLHESDTTLKALPEITHIMRPQDPRPPLAVSLAFTGAVLVPLLGFLGFVFALKLNLNKLLSGSVFVFGVGFLLSLAAILALFVCYWIELTMFQTLSYLAGVGGVNLVFGHFTLKRLAHASVQETKQKTA